MPVPPEPVTAAPLRLITDVPVSEELLAIVICPAVRPPAVGWNWTLSSADWLGLSVSGKLIPDIAKFEPASPIVVMVTGSVPVDVSATDCIEVVFAATSTKLMLVLLGVSVNIYGYNCMA